MSDDPARARLEGFVKEARRILAQPVRHRVRDRRPGGAVRGMSISSAAPAYQAAVLIRDHSLPWLDVVDATNTVIGSVDREALDDTFKLLHLAPYFGEEMMAAIMPPLQPAELEPI